MIIYVLGVFYFLTNLFIAVGCTLEDDFQGRLIDWIIIFLLILFALPMIIVSLLINRKDTTNARR